MWELDHDECPVPLAFDRLQLAAVNEEAATEWVEGRVDLFQVRRNVGPNSTLRRTPGGGQEDVGDSLVAPLRLRAPDGNELSLFSTTTVFGTPREVTISGLAIEAFYPANEQTRQILGGLATG